MPTHPLAKLWLLVCAWLLDFDRFCRWCFRIGKNVVYDPVMTGQDRTLRIIRPHEKITRGLAQDLLK